MIKRILLAFALVGAIAACNSPAATPAVSTTSPDLSSPSTPALESPSESPAAS